MIQLQQVSKYFGKTTALVNCDLTINKGELCFITGHSGAGKSTLLKLIAAIITPSQGQVIINNIATKGLSAAASLLLRREIGLVLQQPLLLNDLTVAQNIALPLAIQAVEGTSINKRVNAVLEQVGLRKKSSCLPAELSAGEAQRVNLARAIINKPKILIADEPTANLDASLALEIFQLLIKLKQLGMTIIIATHDTNLTQQFPYQSIELKNGKLISNN